MGRVCPFIHNNNIDPFTEIVCSEFQIEEQLQPAYNIFLIGFPHGQTVLNYALCG